MGFDSCRVYLAQIGLRFFEFVPVLNLGLLLGVLNG